MVNVKVVADYVSVLYEVLLSWLKILGIFLLIGGVALIALQFSTQSWPFISFLKDFFESFLLVSIVSSITYMPYLLLLSYLFRELIWCNKLGWNNARFIGAGTGTTYGLLISNLNISQNVIPFMMPFFGGLAGLAIGYFLFPRFEKRFFFYQDNESTKVSSDIQRNKKIKLSEFFEIVMLSFSKAMFVTLTMTFLLICAERGSGFFGMLIGEFVFFLYGVAIGFMIGLIIAFPCIILAIFVYRWLLKEDLQNMFVWVLASLFIGQIYVFLLIAIPGVGAAESFSKGFYIPVSTLTGYFSWKKATKQT